MSLEQLRWPLFQGQNTGRRAVWEAPVVAALPIHRTGNLLGRYLDIWGDGMLLSIAPPFEPPADPRARRNRHPAMARQMPLAGWEAPTVTAFAISAGRKIK